MLLLCLILLNALNRLFPYLVLPWFYTIYTDFLNLLNCKEFSQTEWEILCQVALFPVKIGYINFKFFVAID
jgi:hypothetical protein